MAANGLVGVGDAGGFTATHSTPLSSPRCTADALRATAPAMTSSNRCANRVPGFRSFNRTVYLSVPKSGSSTLLRHVFKPVGSLKGNPTATFTFVRNPLDRLLSGYGTISERMRAMSQALLPAWTQEENDVRRFERFVDYLVDQRDQAHRGPQQREQGAEGAGG